MRDFLKAMVTISAWTIGGTAVVVGLWGVAYLIVMALGSIRG